MSTIGPPATAATPATSVLTSAAIASHDVVLVLAVPALIPARRPDLSSSLFPWKTGLGSALGSSPLSNPTRSR